MSAIPKPHMAVMKGIAAGLGAWHGAERPKQRGYRSGVLKDLRLRGLIDWEVIDSKGRYFVTDAGRTALAAATVDANEGNP